VIAAARTAAAVAAALCASACSAAPQPTGTPTAAPTPTQAATTAPTPAAATATPTPTAAPVALCPTTPAAATALPVIWRGGAPDDLAVAPDGALWIGDVTAKVVRRVQGGAVTRTLQGLSDPEGVVAMPNGDVVVAEQGRQRVTAVHPDDSRTVLLTLPPADTQLGVDGIAYDPRTGRFLVPDSPHGTLLSVAPGSPQQATTLATGLGRVVGAVPDATGTAIWLVAEAEAPRGLLHFDPAAGTATPTANLVQLDDVVLSDGVLYVTDLRNHSVHAVDARTGAERTLATGFGEAQGLAVLPDGGIAVADSPRGVVQRIAPCALSRDAAAGSG
jgi:sugar lactone lactonase YvrE